MCLHFCLLLLFSISNEWRSDIYNFDFVCSNSITECIFCLWNILHWILRGTHNTMHVNIVRICSTSCLLLSLVSVLVVHYKYWTMNNDAHCTLLNTIAYGISVDVELLARQWPSMFTCTRHFPLHRESIRNKWPMPMPSSHWHNLIWRATTVRE